VLQKNEGYSYVSQSVEAMGIKPGKACKDRGEKMDRKRNNDTHRKSDRAVKRRRTELKRERSGKQKANEMVEGTTYQSGVSLSGDVTATEYRVPAPVVRPSTDKIEWSESNDYEFIVFDLEATGGGRNAEICQIAAQGTKADDGVWSKYILPSSEFNPFASQVTGLRISMVNGERCLMKDGVQMNALSLEDGMSSFLAYLATRTTPGKMGILVGHNAATFDAPLLVRAFTKCGVTVEDLLKYGIAGFADSLPLLRELRNSKHPSLLKNGTPIHSVSLDSVFHQLFDANFPAHNAMEDVKALRRVLFESPLGIAPKLILEHSIMTSCVQH
jgi:DNA polymerase III epsilon subunit-like protein